MGSADSCAASTADLMKSMSVDWRAFSRCFKTGPREASANQPLTGRPTAAAEADSAASSAA
eukprot:9886112-Alexandrium_andersonii.AAC.1